ncbi:uncharacterized protein LOC131383930 [Hylobates moloch]|uniref:uncharacterized protein LOC131383930 n=1 Tax=Hylobates moloch TaxID=81572 RepID=UPI0026772146|nr:uncharacterized protein LOC131383930 [Hylobates moloch]
MSVSGLESGGGHWEGSQNRFCPICFTNDLFRPEAGSQGWRPFDLQNETRTPAGPLASRSVARSGWEMGVAEAWLLLALSFRALFPPPRSLHPTVGSLSQHHAPSCRAWEQVFLPGRSGGSAPLLSQLRSCERCGGGVLMVVAEEQGHLIGPQEGSSRLTPGYRRARVVAWGEEGSGVTRGQPSSGTALGPAEAARGGARASGPRDCGGGGGAAARSTLPWLLPPRGSQNGALGASLRLAAPFSACAGMGAAGWSRPSPHGEGWGGGGRRPRGNGRAPPSPPPRRRRRR